MRGAYTLSKGGSSVEVTELDLKYMKSLVDKDIRYLEGRGSRRKGEGQDANASKLKYRQQLSGKLDKLQRKD